MQKAISMPPSIRQTYFLFGGLNSCQTKYAAVRRGQARALLAAKPAHNRDRTGPEA